MEVVLVWSSRCWLVVVMMMQQADEGGVGRCCSLIHLTAYGRTTLVVVAGEVSRHDWSGAKKGLGRRK